MSQCMLPSLTKNNRATDIELVQKSLKRWDIWNYITELLLSPGSGMVSPQPVQWGDGAVLQPHLGVPDWRLPSDPLRKICTRCSPCTAASWKTFRRGDEDNSQNHQRVIAIGQKTETLHGEIKKIGAREGDSMLGFKLECIVWTRPS